MIKKNKILTNLSILMFTITGFFSFLIGNIYYLLIASIIPVVLYIFSSVSKIDRDNAVWILFILFLWASVIVSRYSYLSQRFMIGVCILFAAKLILEDTYGWHNAFLKIFYVCALIHTLAVLLSPVFPDFIRGIVDSLYVDQSLDKYTMMFDNQAYAGLNRQTGYAAFFSTVLIGYAVSSILCGNKRIFNSIIAVLGIIAIFFTMKRSFIFSNAFAIIFLFIITHRADKKILGNLFKYVCFFLLGWYILSQIPEVSNVFLKFERLYEANDITNGRIDLWSKTFEIWKDNPIFGTGINTLPSIYGISTHNVFLQILAETGIFGLVTFVLIVAMSLYKSCMLYKVILKDSNIETKEKTIFASNIYMQIIFVIYCFVGNPFYDLNFFLIYIFNVACIKSYKSKITIHTHN